MVASLCSGGSLVSAPASLPVGRLPLPGRPLPLSGQRGRNWLGLSSHVLASRRFRTLNISHFLARKPIHFFGSSSLRNQRFFFLYFYGNRNFLFWLLLFFQRRWNQLGSYCTDFFAILRRSGVFNRIKLEAAATIDRRLLQFRLYLPLEYLNAVLTMIPAP